MRDIQCETACLAKIRFPRHSPCAAFAPATERCKNRPSASKEQTKLSLRKALGITTHWRSPRIPCSEAGKQQFLCASSNAAPPGAFTHASMLSSARKASLFTLLGFCVCRCRCASHQSDVLSSQYRNTIIVFYYRRFAGQSLLLRRWVRETLCESPYAITRCM